MLTHGKNLDEALDRSATFGALTGRDRAFARAIVSATLRRLGRIETVLAQALQRPLHPNASFAKAILQNGAAQLLDLDAPPHAVISEAVDLAKASSARNMAGLINAVLRRIAAEGPALFAAAPPGADLPAWLYTRWRAAYGEAASAIAAALANPAPLDVTPKPNADLPHAIQLPTGSLRLPAGTAVTDLPGYKDGAWWVQDAAAALPAQLFGDLAGARVLDLCAAPGGKTLQLAAAGAAVTALDIDAKRLQRVAANLTRTQFQAELIAADALEWTAPAPFDAVLLDAPCTATGTLRRRPDAAWLRRPTDIPQLAQLQARLLAKAGDFLKPGGILVYAVCSLEPEEGEAIIEAELTQKRFIRAPVDRFAEFQTLAGDWRTLPSHWPELGGLDGFFIARLQKI